MSWDLYSDADLLGVLAQFYEPRSTSQTKIPMAESAAFLELKRRADARKAKEWAEVTKPEPPRETVPMIFREWCERCRKVTDTHFDNTDLQVRCVVCGHVHGSVPKYAVFDRDGAVSSTVAATFPLGDGVMKTPTERPIHPKYHTEPRLTILDELVQRIEALESPRSVPLTYLDARVSELDEQVKILGQMNADQLSRIQTLEDESRRHTAVSSAHHHRLEVLEEHRHTDAVQNKELWDRVKKLGRRR